MTDAVTLAVVRGALEQISDEMDLHLIHAAISPIISETNDCAHGIFHPQTGETIAQGRYGIPVFLANMQLTVQRLIPVVMASGGFRSGDMWIMNDPYSAGTHLQDVTLVCPYFSDGSLVALLASTGHWIDIGGSVPGGWAPRAREIHQEGIVIPPVKLYDLGVRNDALVKLFTANVRLPDQIAGDLSAMTNVFTVARRGLDALVARYGVPRLSACIEEMIVRAERQSRSYIEEIPDGTYRFEDWFDNDGIYDRAIKLALAVTKSGSTLHFDFSGTDPASSGPINLAEITTISACYVALKHIFPEAPVNGGTFRPMTFNIPSGSILAATYPSAVSGYLDVVGRVIDLVFGALSQAIPDRTPAAFFGTTGIVTIGGTHPDTGQYFVGVFPYPGGYGAQSDGDGLVNGTPPQSMANFMSIELSEHRYPLRFRYFRIREDSGGPGQFRGGCGTEYSFEVLSSCAVSVLGDRADHPPFGIAGGRPGAPNRVYFERAGKATCPPMRSKYEGMELRPTDVLSAASPGGGGYGPPQLREVEAVEQDLNLGYISAAIAEDEYGVVIDSVMEVGEHKRYHVDVAATHARRATLARE